MIFNPVITGSGGSATIDSLSITPSTSPQTITATGGVDGYSPISVSAVTSSIDANIQAGNIKDGVTILGTTGTYTGSGGATHYIEKTVDANGILQNGTTFIDLTGVTGIGAKVLAAAYNGNTSITSVNLSNIRTLDESALSSCFSSCTSLTGIVDLSGLTVLDKATCMISCFYADTGITGVNLSQVTEITGSSALSQAFGNCTGITAINLSSLRKVGNKGMYNCFQGCRGITGVVDLSSLIIVGTGQSGESMRSCFTNCFGITGVNMSSLTIINDLQGLASCFSGSSNLASVDLSSLSTVNSRNCMQYCFSTTALTSLTFPALRNVGTSRTDQFNQMLSGVSNCTVHFPSNMQSVIGSWTDVVNGFSGSGTTVLFDLPATVILTGVNTTEYERNPKYDTATALAWRVKDTGTTYNPIIDWTPYYTSGTTDPAVSDTIYSDSACTVAVTTIDSIA